LKPLKARESFPDFSHRQTQLFAQLFCGFAAPNPLSWEKSFHSRKSEGKKALSSFTFFFELRKIDPALIWKQNSSNLELTGLQALATDSLQSETSWISPNFLLFPTFFRLLRGRFVSVFFLSSRYRKLNGKLRRRAPPSPQKVRCNTILTHTHNRLSGTPARNGVSIRKIQ
jgi:hypothetical protein